MTDTKMLDRIRDLVPDIAARAVDTERERRVPDRTVRELTDAGVFRMLQPREFGGAEASPVEFFAVVRALAAGCPSTGWVTSVFGTHAWQLALFSAAAQHDVWGADPDSVIATSYVPSGRVTRVPGGFELSGRWSFSSGCQHAGWIMVGALTTADDPAPGAHLTLLLPRADCTIDEVWQAVGLAGTGSHDLVVDAAFVPAHRVHDAEQHNAEDGPDSELPALYRLPFTSILPGGVTAPLLGAAEGAYAAFLDRMRGRESGPGVAERVSRVAAEIDAGILQLEHNLAAALRCAEAGEEIPLDLRLRARRDQVRAVERAVDATTALFRLAGGRAARSPDVLERHWRDVTTGSLHRANSAERPLINFGQGALGLPVADRIL
ncbi:3-hydroxy-9,10-secoandrosta-1,3,5(10)-triene-9,17-dione monooxygenase oxygenase subunit [Nocardia sp. BMG111209]|uniref:3-hydroxy-9,10-secoandrosta-1,3,5(10)-triene-9, 17-dione monooxygenase oxygenase subunit n=1 Tax=Nocardia sp. BMG111209 TaxID=1160137 RepID=UPI0003620C31|nr:3-hydroxy-9,10-secoandrosta-1,3,5(10)-triene-9,17-dione monooxygenase oxygenase subunit [Nocardia sp. BMG111209]